MSRRPQILHIIDSSSSRQKNNQTYTKNSLAKKCYEISDWETYSVLPQGHTKDEDGMSEVCLNDLGRAAEVADHEEALQVMMQQVENTYATIQRRHLDDTRTIHVEVHDMESPALQNFCELELASNRTESPVRNISPNDGGETTQVSDNAADVIHTSCLSPLKEFSEVKLENVELGSQPENITQAQIVGLGSESQTQHPEKTQTFELEVEKLDTIKEHDSIQCNEHIDISPKPFEITKTSEEKVQDQRSNLEASETKLQEQPKRVDATNDNAKVREKFRIKELKCMFEDTTRANSTFVKKTITRSESLASVIPAHKTSLEVDRLKELQKGDHGQLMSDSLSKERSTSLLNLNSPQTDKLRFKKLGAENNKKNAFNEVTCSKGHFKLTKTASSINRSMPEYLNESFAIENPKHRIRAIENHLNHIHKTNLEKMHNSVKKSISCPSNDHQVHKKVSRAPNCNNLLSEKRNNMNGHDKLTGTKSNEERSTNSENLRKVAAFDGLLQYLQDYRLGLRELLVNNNVVIIEPVRESSPRPDEERGLRDVRAGSAEGSCRITGAMIKNMKPLPGKKEHSYTLSRQQLNQPKIKRHFFYHPCKKVNPYLVDKELPDPDLVKNGRQKYEEFLKLKIKKEQILAGCATPIKTRTKFCEDVETKNEENDANTKRKSQRFLTVDTVFRDKILKRWTDSGSLSSGISSDLSCCDTDLESPSYDTKHDYSSSDEDFDSFNSKNFEVEYHYVAPEVLEKIRACGESTTYYGGRIVSSTKGTSPMNCIMNEIQEDNRGRNASKNYLGVKFRLVKSNSCGSRLELAGAEETPTVKTVERSHTFYRSSPRHDTARMETLYRVSNTDDTEDMPSKKPVTFFSHVPNDIDLGAKQEEKSKAQIELKLIETKQDVAFRHKPEDIEVPLVKVQKVVEEIEALNFDVKRGENKPAILSSPVTKDLKPQSVAPTETQDEKGWKQEFTYKAMAKKYEMIEEVTEEGNSKEKTTPKTLEDEEMKAKKEMVEFKEVYANIKRGAEGQKVPENRGRVVPKVLLSIEKPKTRVCDMEFETFEVLDTTRKADSHVCCREDSEEMDRDSLSSLDNSEDKIPMTSWASQQQAVAILEHSGATTQSSC